MPGIKEGLDPTQIDIAGRCIHVVHATQDQLQRAAFGADDEVYARQVLLEFILQLMLQEE